MLRQRVPRDTTGLVGERADPARRGAPGVRAREYRTAIDRIEPLGARIVELGGSRAQRDVFHDTLLEACFRAGDGERATRLLAERVARRPDHYWVTAGRRPPDAGGARPHSFTERLRSLDATSPRARRGP